MEPKSESDYRSVLLMLLSIVLFAANVLLLRGISLHAPRVDGYVASVFRGVIGMGVVWAVFRGRGFQPGHLVARPMVLLRGAVGAVAILIFYVSIAHLGAGRAVIINLTYPIFGALMAAVWLREPLRIQQLIWMGAALVGLGFFFAGDAWSGGVSRYEVLGVGGAVVAGIAVVLIRVLRHSEHSSTIFASQCVWSAVAALPFCSGPLPELSGWALTGLVVASVAVAGGQLALTEAFRSLSVARGSSMQMLLPVLTGVGGMIFFGERYRALELLGALLTLFSTWRVVGAAPISGSGRNPSSQPLALPRTHSN